MDWMIYMGLKASCVLGIYIIGLTHRTVYPKDN